MWTPTNIEPFTVVTTQTVTSFTVSCRSINLFQDASFSVDSFDATGKIVSRQIVEITPEEYNQWNNDDSFIINLIAQKLGYIITR
jgi:hypothetical protein